MAELLTVFANFRIDSEERLLRMQDSFRSFRNARIDKWVINIRGPLQHKAGGFLAKELGESLVLSYVESGRGWFVDTREMLHHITSQYVFFWVEDQLCLAGNKYFDAVVRDMQWAGAESLQYTAFHAGDTLKSFDCLPLREFESVIVVNYDRARHRQRQESIAQRKLLCSEFILSATSIMKRAFFERVVMANDPLIKRWPRETPFDFEKTPEDRHWLPIRVAVPKQELFAFIDDDHGRPGNSLISRGLYPNRASREEMLLVRQANLGGPRSRLRAVLLRLLRNTVNGIHSQVRRIPGFRF